MPAPLNRLVLGVALLAAVPAAFAQATPAASGPAVTAGAKVYAPADFARYSPKNALDMLQQVPGFVIRDAVVERGMGQATGNVLLNGQRLSGKSNDVLDQLTKIPAANVVRIEIVDGAKLDIPGLSGQVANVVTQAGGISGSWNWKPDVRRYYTNPQLTRGAISISGSKPSLDYTFGFDNSANHSGAGGNTWIYNPDGSLRETRDDAWTGENERPRLTGHASWRGAGGSVGNLNASVQKIFYHYTEDGERFGDPDVADRERSVRQKEFNRNYELGGDYEFGLGSGRLKLIGLDRFSTGPSETTVETSFADATPTDGVRFAQDPEENERIARAEYRWKWNGDWQLSGEYAFNSLDNTSSLFVLDPTSGDYQEVPLPGGSATVQEDRYEMMGTYGRAISPALSFQLSVGGEYSKLSQVGAGGLTRSFKRPKGTLTVAWKASPTLNFNMKLQRRVGQLNFYDFMASVDLNNGQANAGNPELVPPQTWELEFEAIKDLGAYGNTSLRAYRQRIDDIVDIIPIGATGESPGNIDRASVVGVEWKATLNTEPFGWRGAKIDAHVQFERSDVIDPLTHEHRPISGNLKELAELSLRHDIPDTLWAWGADMSYSFYARDYRLTEVGRFWEGPIWADVFIERKDFHGVTARLVLNNLFNAASMWDRTVYLDRRTGPIDYIQDQHRRIGPILSLQLSGKF